MEYSASKAKKGVLVVGSFMENQEMTAPKNACFGVVNDDECRG